MDRSAFEGAFYCPPGTHPDTPTLCSAPIVAARRRARSEGYTLIEGTASLGGAGRHWSRSEAYESLRDEILDQLAPLCRSTSCSSGSMARWWRTAMTTAKAIC